MCGRFTLKASPVELTDRFGLAELPPIEPRYNIAPTQTVFAVRVSAAGSREPALLRWGLISSWADDAKIGYPHCVLQTQKLCPASVEIRVSRMNQKADISMALRADISFAL
jgi:putative SOS response-associated peptidase YedK